MKEIKNKLVSGEPATVEMTLTPEMVKMAKETFDIELEMMQGEKEALPDGRTKFTIEVKGDKAKLILEFMLKVMSQSHKANLS